MLFVQTAWKNIFRYKRRTFITALAIAIGVLCSIVMDGFLFGMGEESNRNLIWYESGAAKFFAKDYFADRKLLTTDYLIDGGEKAAVAALLEKSGLAYAPRFLSRGQIFFTEEFFPAAGSADIILAGVDPGREAQVFRNAAGVSEGSWLSGGASVDEGAVIGGWLAEDIGAKVGSCITVQAKGRGGFIQTFDIPVSGIAITDNPAVNDNYLFVDLAYLDELLELDGAVTEVAVAFDTSANQSVIDREYPKLKAAFDKTPPAAAGAVELYSWQEIHADIIALINSKSSIIGFLLIFIFIIAAVGISNTMLMAVMERKNEVAMLRALGYGGRDIRRLFMYEGFFIGVFGVCSGLIAGLALNWYLVNTGIDFSYMFRGVDAGFRITGIMRSAWHWSTITGVTVGALAVSALCAYLPVGGMLKKEIAALFHTV